MQAAWSLIGVIVVVVGGGALAVAVGVLTFDLVDTADPSRLPHCPGGDDGRGQKPGRDPAIGRDH